MHQSRNPNSRRHHSTSPHRRHRTSPCRRNSRRHSIALTRRHSTSPQQINNGNIDEQWSDRGRVDSGLKVTPVTGRWFRRPPCSKKGKADVIQVYKTNKVRLIGGILLLVHIIILAVYSFVAFKMTENTGTKEYITYGSFVVVSVCYLVRYLDNVQLLFSSKFERKEKGLVRYLVDLLFEVLGLNGLQIAGLICQFIDGKQHIATFVFGICIVIIRPIGNAMLIVKKGRKNQKPDLTVNELGVNDPTPASDPENHIELQLINQADE